MHMAPIFFQDLADSQMTSNKGNMRIIAREALNNDKPISLSPIPTELHLTGTKLMKITQVIAYKTIRGELLVPQRSRTRAMISKVKTAIAKVNKRTPSEKQIWLSFRSKDFSKLLRIFLCKCAHDTYKVGPYWNCLNMKLELRVRGMCKHDNGENSLNHILTECICTSQFLVWEK